MAKLNLMRGPGDLPTVPDFLSLAAIGNLPGLVVVTLVLLLYAFLTCLAVRAHRTYRPEEG